MLGIGDAARSLTNPQRRVRTWPRIKQLLVKLFTEHAQALRGAQDFACGLSLPQNTSSLNPLSSTDPWDGTDLESAIARNRQWLRGGHQFLFLR
jgi:hypothetical protein